MSKLNPNTSCCNQNPCQRFICFPQVKVGTEQIEDSARGLMMELLPEGATVGEVRQAGYLEVCMGVTAQGTGIWK